MGGTIENQKQIVRIMAMKIKKHLLNIGNFHGHYLVPLSLVGIYITIFHLEYVLHAMAAIIFSYAFFEGIRILAVNSKKREEND